jgi:hypothetical protein
MQLLYGTTSSLVVTITERFFGGRYYLYFADRINADPPNPPSSNPLRILFDYDEIFRRNDVKNPKFVAHQLGVREAIRKQISDPDTRRTARQTIRALHIHGMQPYLAMLANASTWRAFADHLPLPVRQWLSNISSRICAAQIFLMQSSICKRCIFRGLDLWKD